MKQKYITLIMVDDIGYLHVQYHDSADVARIVGTEFIMRYGGKHMACDGHFRSTEHYLAKKVPQSTTPFPKAKHRKAGSS